MATLSETFPFYEQKNFTGNISFGENATYLMYGILIFGGYYINKSKINTVKNYKTVTKA